MPRTAAQLNGRARVDLEKSRRGWNPGAGRSGTGPSPPDELDLKAPKARCGIEVLCRLRVYKWVQEFRLGSRV